MHFFDKTLTEPNDCIGEMIQIKHEEQQPWNRLHFGLEPTRNIDDAVQN